MYNWKHVRLCCKDWCPAVSIAVASPCLDLGTIVSFRHQVEQVGYLQVLQFLLDQDHKNINIWSLDFDDHSKNRILSDSR